MNNAATPSLDCSFSRHRVGHGLGGARAVRY